MLDVTFSMFFDREGVKKKVKDGTKSALAKFGAFVRIRAKRSIRNAPKKKKIVPVPGSPPRSYTGHLKNLIFFGYDTGTDSVVIGPQLFRKRTPMVPSLLEFGGRTRHWKTGKPATYRAFPFMKPALAGESPKFASLFTGVVKG